jgi:hypothetical protein
MHCHILLLVLVCAIVETIGQQLRIEAKSDSLLGIEAY